MSRFTRLLSVCFFLAGCITSIAQPERTAVETYIARYKPMAVKQMENFGIPASVILAQAIFESDCGKSDLAKRSNNHFGIKCHNTWLGDTVNKTDDVQNECFRKYGSVEDSYRDHSIFLRTRKWYVHLFRLSLTDYRGWCRGLKDAGYATYPTYAEELIRIIEKYQLHKLDAAEKLQAVTLIFTQPDIRLQNPNNEPALSQLAHHDLLFSDEGHFVIRSLDMHIPVPSEAQRFSPVAAAGDGSHGQ